MNTPIHITGMGLISSIGNSITEFSNALYKGTSGIETCGDYAAAKLKSFSFIEELTRMEALTPGLYDHAKKLGMRAPLPMQTAILCALQAWQHAKLYEHDLASDRIGIVVTGDNTSQLFHYETLLKFLKAPEYVSPRYALQSLHTDTVGTISQLLSIQGEGFAVSGASASGNVAIIKAAQMLQLGLLDACLVIGTLSELSPLAIQAYRNIGALGQLACRPFDAGHAGFNYGEASACLILETGQSQERRQAASHALYKGGAIYLDGNHLADPDVKGEAKVMSKCLQQSGLAANDIDYINAHGSSSPLGDVTEINAIKLVFNDSLNKVWINSTKGLTGHCLFSAGIVETIACVIQMQNEFIHTNHNLQHPIASDCRFARETATNETIQYAMNNSFGFGGINTSIVLEKRAAACN